MFTLRPMTAADADAVAGWRYPGEYAFYDAGADAADLALLLDPAGWGTRYFAADLDGELAGFFEFKPAAGDVREVGLGLRPDLTGRGLGAAFLAAGLEFAAQRFGDTRFALAVAAFNRRAISVYERAGFRAVRRFAHETGGAVHEFVWMTRDINPRLYPPP